MIHIKITREYLVGDMPLDYFNKEFNAKQLLPIMECCDTSELKRLLSMFDLAERKSEYLKRIVLTELTNRQKNAA